MPSREVAKLAAIASDAAARTPDRPAQLAATIREAISSTADPMMLAGVLIEGVAVTISTLIPEEKRTECTVAAIMLLQRRVRR